MRFLISLLFLLPAFNRAFADVQLQLHDYGFMAEAIRHNTNFFDFRLNNRGNESLRGIVHGDLYLSTDGALDSSDRLLAQVDQSFNQFPLNPGGQTIVRFNVEIPPVPPGLYYVIMVLSGGTPAINEVYVGPFEILAPDFLVFDFGALTAIRVLEPLQVSWVFKNTGNGTSKGTNSQDLFFSRDAFLSSDDLFITNVTSSANLGKDFGGRLTTPKVPLPADPRGGFFIVRVDSDNQIAELDEQNNIFAFPVPPQKELKISQTETTISLFWSASLGQQTLESSEPVYPARWSIVSGGGELSGENYVVQLTKPSAPRIYRIR